MVDPARKRILIDRSSTSFKPGKKAGSHVTRNLKLDRPPRLLLNDDRSRLYLQSGYHIANPDLDEVTAAKLAVDREIEQGSVPDASLAIKEEADRPICFWVNGRLVPTFFPGFQATRSRLASSNMAWPMSVLLGLDWPREERRRSLTGAASRLSASGRKTGKAGVRLPTPFPSFQGHGFFLKAVAHSAPN